MDWNANQIFVIAFVLLLLVCGCSKKNQSGATVDDSSGYRVIKYEDGTEYELPDQR